MHINDTNLYNYVHAHIITDDAAFVLHYFDTLKPFIPKGENHTKWAYESSVILVHDAIYATSNKRRKQAQHLEPQLYLIIYYNS